MPNPCRSSLSGAASTPSINPRFVCMTLVKAMTKTRLYSQNDVLSGRVHKIVFVFYVAWF
jgi:hypothetical protein